jgi:hypothetical protein
MMGERWQIGWMGVNRLIYRKNTAWMPSGDISLNSTPIALGVKGRRSVRLPLRIESAEEEHVAVEVGANRVDGLALIVGRGNGSAIGVALMRPARLGDDDALVAAGCSNLVDLFLDKRSGV